MPLWYYEKKDLRNTPSFRDGIEPEVEARYRREGARFITDCGTKLGLRYDSCATGVVFFHRFYMFHSFREFHRHVTAACCLFLAGKTEETPKKCKDIIKTTRSMLTEAQMMVFGDDPKEEVMTMERILLQTIKFDLMVEHPYAYLLKFAKMIKSKSDSADKGKVQKLVQMAWTFINDSLCTMLCLQWEPEVIAVSLMYLASRLTKTDVTDWQGKPPSFKGKWWEYLVEDITQELLEDVCHQVLDLYSTAPKKGAREDTPPPPPPPPPKPSHGSSSASSTPQPSAKRPRSPNTSLEAHRSHSHGSHSHSKVSRSDKRPPSPPSASKDRERYQAKQLARSASVGSALGKTTATATQPAPHPSSAPSSAQPPKPVSSATSTQNNPYIASGMYSSSFMTQEGSQSIQSLVGGRSTAAPAATYPATQTYPAGPPPVQPANTQVPAAPSTSYTSQPPTYPQTYQQPYQQPATYPSTTQASYSQPPPGYTQPYSYPTSTTQYPQSATTYQQPPPQQPPPQQPAQQTQQHHPPPQQSTGYNQSYPAQPQQQQQQYPASQQYSSQYPGYSAQNYQNFAPTQSYQAPQAGRQPPPQGSAPAHPGQNPSSGLSVRLTSRQ